MLSRTWAEQADRKDSRYLGRVDILKSMIDITSRTRHPHMSISVIRHEDIEKKATYCPTCMNHSDKEDGTRRHLTGQSGPCIDIGYASWRWLRPEASERSSL